MDGLVGDIGGTHARFALASHGAILEPRTYANKDYPSAEAAIEAYLSSIKPRRQPKRVVVAVAGPVTDGAIDFTNSDWILSEDQLRRAGGFQAARLINDFAAQALGAPRTAAHGLKLIGPAVRGEPEETLAILGPGTGFGVAGLTRQGGREIVLATEGGHAGFAPCDEVEVQVWRWLQRRHDHVSIERILSGPGLYELYQALAEIEGKPAALTDQRAVQAACKTDALAGATVERFCLILGAAAGDLTLALGARGGVYVTGGVAQGLAEQIAAGGFRQRFEAKGRFEAYMQAIPTWLILEPYTALIGAASLLGSLEPA
jgi:glucokinase